MGGGRRSTRSPTRGAGAACSWPTAGSASLLSPPTLPTSPPSSLGVASHSHARPPARMHARTHATACARTHNTNTHPCMWVHGGGLAVGQAARQAARSAARCKVAWLAACRARSPARMRARWQGCLIVQCSAAALLLLCCSAALLLPTGTPPSPPPQLGGRGDAEVVERRGRRMASLPGACPAVAPRVAPRLAALPGPCAPCLPPPSPPLVAVHAGVGCLLAVCAGARHEGADTRGRWYARALVREGPDTRGRWYTSS